MLGGPQNATLRMMGPVLIEPGLTDSTLTCRTQRPARAGRVASEHMLQPQRHAFWGVAFLTFSPNPCAAGTNTRRLPPEGGQQTDQAHQIQSSSGQFRGEALHRNVVMWV